MVLFGCGLGALSQRVSLCFSEVSRDFFLDLTLLREIPRKPSVGSLHHGVCLRCESRTKGSLYYFAMWD